MFLPVKTEIVDACGFREWRVGDQTQTSQENNQHSVYQRRPGVPADCFLPHHPEKTCFLHHQHYCSLRTLLLPRPPGLLFTCQRFLSF